MATTRILEWLGRFYIVLLLAFLYLPIVIMTVMGFNESASYALPFQFSTRWFEQLAGNEVLLKAGWNSVLLAIVNTVVATILGTMAAIAFARYAFRGKVLLQILLFPPIAIPWLILATAMLIFFFYSGIGRGLHAMLLAHVALSLPSNEAVRSAVLSSDALTAVSFAVVEDDIAAGRLLPVGFDLPERAFRLLRHKERYRSKAALAFEAML